MRKTALILAVAIAVPKASVYSQSAAAPSAVGDIVSICEEYGHSDVVFLGRAEPPVTIRISAEAETENARQNVISIQRELAQLRASLDPRTRLERELALETRLQDALIEFDNQETMYTAFDGDYTFVPIIVEQTFRGLSESTLMLRLVEPSLNLKPGERRRGDTGVAIPGG